MGVSPGKSKPKVAHADHAALGNLAFQKILYRVWFFVALLACVASLAALAAAQEDRPQITPGERTPAKKKKDAGPRALAVLQLAANGKASLVPVAILVDGKFWDASAYKANPVHMALEPGSVYEAEQAGNSLGLFTVNSALHSNAVNVQTPWLGTGAWVPEGADSPKKAFKAEKAPVGLAPNDMPPRLTRRDSHSGDAPAAPASVPPQPTPSGSAAPTQTNPSQTNPSQTNPSSTSPSQTGSNPTPSNSPAPNPAPTQTGDTKPADSKPSDSKTSDAKPVASSRAAQSSSAASDSGADESSRPRLRRGKPIEPLPEDEVPGYSKPGTAASTNAAKPGDAAKSDHSTAENNPTRLIPAISDAGGPQPKSFAFQWLKEEEGERLQQMTALAKEQVRAYVVQQAKNKIPAAPTPKPATSKTAYSTVTPKPKDPILENVQMKAYDLWGNNQPILVFTADAHMPPPPASAPHSADSDLQYSIVLVANPDIYNNLHKLYLGITDKYHLDITPRLELVDAIDADGDGRGELLFREASDNANGWILYRATADKLWKLFDSLSPE